MFQSLRLRKCEVLNQPRRGEMKLYGKTLMLATETSEGGGAKFIQLMLHMFIHSNIKLSFFALFNILQYHFLFTQTQLVMAADGC